MAISELITRLGGGAAVAAELGVTPSAVSRWIADGAVPARRTAALLRMARRLDVDWTPPGFEGLSPFPAAPPDLPKREAARTARSLVASEPAE
jgi:transcriptional regulator with XRE-family HTH domain